ncbi:MAG: GAF domain-containing sensor histidine kinase [Bacteroidota bacterium]
MSYIYPSDLKIFPQYSNKWVKLVLYGAPFLLSVIIGVYMVKTFYTGTFTGQNLLSFRRMFYFPVILVLTFYLIWGTRNLFSQYYSPGASRKNKTSVINLLTGLIGFVFIVLSMYLMYREKSIAIPVGSVIALLTSLFFAYSVMSNKSIPIRKFIRGGIAYSIISGTVFAIYFLIIKKLSEVAELYLGVNTIAVDIVFIFVLVLLLQPFTNIIQSTVDSVFYRGVFRYRSQFNNFTHDLLGVSDITKFMELTGKFLLESFNISELEIILLNETKNKYVGWFHGIELSPHCSLVSTLQNERNTLESESLSALLKQSVDERYTIFKPVLAYPLIAENKLIGVLMLGAKPGLRGYTIEEIEILSIFSSEVSIGIHNIFISTQIRENELKLQQMEKLAALGRLTASIAHEFRNPLNIISTSTQTLLRQPENTSLHKEVSKYILTEVKHLDRTISDFLELAKPHAPKWEEVCIMDLLHEVVSQVTSLARKNNVRVTISADKVQSIITSRNHLLRALVNLCTNGIEAMNKGGELLVSVHKKAKGKVVISVSDTGSGISDGVRKHLYEPFFTTKENGTGLGLSITSRMISTIRGDLDYTSNSKKTIFQITLPENGTFGNE